MWKMGGIFKNLEKWFVYLHAVAWPEYFEVWGDEKYFFFSVEKTPLTTPLPSWLYHWKFFIYKVLSNNLLGFLIFSIPYIYKFQTNLFINNEFYFLFQFQVSPPKMKEKMFIRTKKKPRRPNKNFYWKNIMSK